MIRRSIGIVAAVGILASGAHAQFGGRQGQVRQAEIKKNVLVIVMDDIGTDKLSFYEHTNPTCAQVPCGQACGAECVEPYPYTPRLDELRRSGVWFTNAYAMPVCSSTRACIQTGRYPLRTGIGDALDAATDSFALSNSEVFIPEFLRDGFPPPQLRSNLPYKSAAFGKWHLTGTIPGNPSDPNWGHAILNGYDRFFGSMGNVGDHFRWTKVKVDPSAWFPVDPPTFEVIDGRTSQTFTTATWQTSVTGADALDWILQQAGNGSPFFAYVCFSSAHAAWQVPPLSLLSPSTQDELACAGLTPGNGGPDCPEELQLIYRAMVEAMDTEIAALLDGIPRRVRNNTMVFVLGDNGTDHNVIDADAHDPTHGKGTLMQWGINVPLIASGPLIPTPASAEGWKSDALVSVVDLWRTILAITGANEANALALNGHGPSSPPWTIDSVSFLPVLQNPSSLGARPPVFSQFFKPPGVWAPAQCVNPNRRATTNGAYKYIRNQIAGTCASVMYTELFYRLISNTSGFGDFEETTDLLDGQPYGSDPFLPGSEDEENLTLLRNAMDAIVPD